MIFVARCLGVSLSVFFLLYAALSLCIGRGWKFVSPLSERVRPRAWARLLVGMRLFPFAAAAIVTLAITVPSFLLLEPRHADEELGIIPVLLGLACLVLLGWGARTAMLAYRETSVALSSWLKGAAVMSCKAKVRIFRTGKHSPTLTVAGVYAPRVLVSESTMSVLSEAELETALGHEMAHVRSHDNLKKLLFRFSAFPGMAALERAWSETAEIAADADAVSNEREALDLAAALIKLSRLAPIQPSAQLATALLRTSDAVSVRVERLFAWREQDNGSLSAWWYLMPISLAAVAIPSYGTLLAAMHSITEWLVR